MRTNPEIHKLDELLDRLEEATEASDEVTLGAILDEVGRRSFGPLLLLAGLVVLAPIIGDIPGMPTVTGVFVLLIAAQLLFGREHFWLPKWLLERSVAAEKLRKVVGKWLRPPARFVDRLLRPRLTYLVRPTRVYAVACIAIALVMPIMEVVPFSANLAGAALTAFGLALIAHDGLLAIFAFTFTAGTLGLAVYGVL